MKRHILLFLMFILMNASFAMAEWTGDTLEPKLENSCYQIGTPEEFVWLATNLSEHYSAHCVELVADIVFGKDKKTVNREYPLKKIETYFADVDFKGYTVYGAYTEDPTLFQCYRGIAKNVSLKNFEIRINRRASIMPVLLDKSEGNVITEGVIKVTGDSVIASIETGSFIDGVLENRTPIIVESPYIISLWIKGSSSFETLGIDSTLVREAVNYADITIKADSLSSLTVGGVCTEESFHGLTNFCELNSRFYKLSNYGNINIDTKKVCDEMIVSGVGRFTLSSDVSPEIYNEGNIFIKTDSLRRFKVSGLSRVDDASENNTIKFAKALNRGNITILADYSSSIAEVGGCFLGCGYSENLINEGNIDVEIDQLVGEHYIGGVCATGSLLKNAVNIGNVNVSYDEVRIMNAASAPPSVIGGLVARVIRKVERSVNFGSVNVKRGTYVGGAVGMLDESDASQVMNFGAVTTRGCSRIGGVFGKMVDISREKVDRYIKDVANLGDVIALDSIHGSLGGIAGEAYNYISNSYNAGKVVPFSYENPDEKRIPLSYDDWGENSLKFDQTFYDWNVFYGTKTQPEWIWYEKKARTTSQMQSNDFVKELNYVDSTNTNSKVWTLSKLYPYPIIADMEGILKENQERLPIIPVRKNKSVASFGLNAEGMNLLVSGARVGTPYAVFSLLGKSIARGRISSQNQKIPVASTGTYIVKVGKSSRSIVVK